jgi:hypothetical protein
MTSIAVTTGQYGVSCCSLVWERSCPLVSNCNLYNSVSVGIFIYPWLLDKSLRVHVYDLILTGKYLRDLWFVSLHKNKTNHKKKSK